MAADVLGRSRWLKSVQIAGENPLLAYLLAPFLLSLVEIAGDLVGGQNLYDAARQYGTSLGLLASAVFAWVVVRLTGWLRELGLRFQL